MNVAGTELMPRALFLACHCSIFSPAMIVQMISGTSIQQFVSFGARAECRIGPEANTNQCLPVLLWRDVMFGSQIAMVA